LTVHGLHAADNRRRGVLDRVAVFAASPATTLLTLLLELLLSLGVRKAKVELDAIVISGNTVEVPDDSFRDLTRLEAENEVSWNDDEG
jgi:hypothetical protein